MDLTALIVGLGVPLLTFFTGFLTFRYTKNDQRSRLATDIAILSDLPETSTARVALAQSIDVRTKRLVRQESNLMDNELTRYLMIVGWAVLAAYSTLTLVLEPDAYDGWRGPVGVVANVALFVGILLVAASILGQVVVIAKSIRS
ncbi:hypothetical protein CH254_16830 [Rhodococcus sp. 06-412-2C]|uniref:hypothetical protein n=1 Tax=unclassified Rhodococcus (in: high G+C Gram-positive bacteria) TaxID=192944 RepID=UPI000B9A3AD8|nr:MULTISPECIES: hypothetical protein [unclassified Rhodococcus (in: high G+C Gram-positive bacteria)]OZC87314.1 hypothetical protein CH254_16830 [Rhodococcus sp. 06-412-2C]OZD00754.1 hypothetical protein CH279_07195 [Rhodococcus sp. 06-412-2B]